MAFSWPLFLCLNSCGVQLAFISVYEYLLCSVLPIYLIAVFSLAYILNCSVQLAFISVYEYLLCSVWPIYLIAVFSWPIFLCLSTCGVQLALFLCLSTCGVQLALFLCLSTCNVQLAAYISGCCTLRSSVVTDS